MFKALKNLVNEFTGVTLATLMLIFDVIRSKAERMRYWQGSARDLPDAPNGNVKNVFVFLLKNYGNLQEQI